MFSLIILKQGNIVMDYKIENKKFILPAFEPQQSINERSFDLYNKITHVFFRFIHLICPCFNKSVSVRLNKKEIIHVSVDSYQKWRSSAHFASLVNMGRDLNIDLEKKRSIPNEIKEVIKVLKAQKALEYDFKHPVALEIFNAIEANDNQSLVKIFETTPAQTLTEALKSQDTRKNVNILAFAAHRNNFQAVDLISAFTDVHVLKEILIQKDIHEWTPLHHLALMDDQGLRYKDLKKKADIDTKKVSRFLCESPSMLRKYIRSDASKFSTESKTKPLQLYFRQGEPDQKEEQHLAYAPFIREHGHQFSIVPRYFKSIPQINAEVFRSKWAEMKEPMVRDENKLLLIDQHLQSIFDNGEENGLALTPIKHNDRGEKIPEEIKVGVGLEARRDFRLNEVVTLYGGEYFTDTNPSNYPSSDYGFGNDKKENIDGLYVRSYGSSAVHSAPNVKFEENTVLGVTFVAFKAIDDIQTNQQVCINYGPEYFKGRGIVPLETRPEARDQMRINPSQNETIKWMQQSYLKIQSQG